MSWFATCQQINYGDPYDSSHQNNCTITAGPLISGTKFVISFGAEFLKSREHELVAGFTIVLAISTIFVWISTRDAARAGARGAEIAEHALTKLERAFVGIQQIRYLSHMGPDNKVWWSFHITWENSGASRAKAVKVFVGRYLEKKDMDPSFKFDVPENRRSTFIAPHGSIGSGEISVTGEDLVAVRDGKKFLYLWGRADYRDIFDITPDHVTKFFVRVTGVRGNPEMTWDGKTRACLQLGGLCTRTDQNQTRNTVLFCRAAGTLGIPKSVVE